MSDSNGHDAPAQAEVLAGESDDRLAELLQKGARPLISYQVLQMPDGCCFTHADIYLRLPDPELEPEKTEQVRATVDFAHSILLDVLRREIDRVSGEVGTAAKRMWLMAMDPEPQAVESKESR